MTPETSSNTAVDWEVLRDFLLSDRTPDTGMRPAEVDGYLTGIAVSPDMIPPSDWLPVIWDGGEPEFTGIGGEQGSRSGPAPLQHHPPDAGQDPGGLPAGSPGQLHWPDDR